MPSGFSMHTTTTLVASFLITLAAASPAAAQPTFVASASLPPERAAQPERDALPAGFELGATFDDEQAALAHAAVTHLLDGADVVLADSADHVVHFVRVGRDLVLLASLFDEGVHRIVDVRLLRDGADAIVRVSRTHAGVSYFILARPLPGAERVLEVRELRGRLESAHLVQHASL